MCIPCRSLDPAQLMYRDTRIRTKRLVEPLEPLGSFFHPTRIGYVELSPLDDDLSTTNEKVPDKPRVGRNACSGSFEKKKHPFPA